MEKTKLRVGYACINLSLERSFRNFRLKTVEEKDEKKITEVIWHNIRLLKTIIEYNIAHNIYVYRVTSDLIPFCTHPYMQEIYREKVLNNEEMQGYFNAIKEFSKKYHLRLSIHPSQFNVLSSPRKEVVERSILEINGQSDWIRRMNGSNVVLHMGGAYGDKSKAIETLKSNLQYVDTTLLSLENDDKTYNAEEVCSFCQRLKLKWVYDYHHNRCCPSEGTNLDEMIKTYPPDKYHLSTGKPNLNSRSHADYVTKEDFKAFEAYLTKLGILRADVVFEAKLKNKAVNQILKPIGEGYWELA